MARRQKAKKIQEATTFSNVFQPDVKTQGKWQEYFGNANPITLELGCGTGAYTLGLARMFPKRNFIGVDIKGARIWKGAKTALEEKIKNVAFLRTPIERLTDFFGNDPRLGGVSEIWIPFPDPFPRKKQWKNRLTSPKFLAMYKKLLMKGGNIHLKTDDEDFFRYTIDIAPQYGFEIQKVDENVKVDEKGIDPVYAIQTVYEKRHRGVGKRIYYVMAG